jgi:hypothetical protein
MSMVVGICEVTIGLPDCDSLKEKRSVMRRIIERTRNKQPVSIAEVDEMDSLDVGIVGFSVVSNDRRFVNSLIDKVVTFMDELGVARVVDHSYEIINY